MPEFSDDIMSRIPRISEKLAADREQERINSRVQQEEDEKHRQEQTRLENRARALGLEVVGLVKKCRLLSIPLYESLNQNGIPVQQLPRNSSARTLHHFGRIGRLWPLYVQEQTIYHDIPGYRSSTKREQISITDLGDITEGIGIGRSTAAHHKIMKNAQPSDVVRDGELRAALNPHVLDPIDAIKLMETDDFKDNLAKVIFDSSEQTNEFPTVYFRKQGKAYEVTDYSRASSRQ